MACQGAEEIAYWGEMHHGMRAVESMVAANALDRFPIGHIKGVIGLLHFSDETAANLPRIVEEQHLEPLPQPSNAA